MVIAHSYVKLPEGTFCFLSPVSAGEKNPSKTPQLSHGSTTMNVSGGHNDSLTTGTPQTWKTYKKNPSQQHRLFFQPQGFPPQKKLNRHLHDICIVLPFLPEVYLVYLPPDRPGQVEACCKRLCAVSRPGARAKKNPGFFSSWSMFIWWLTYPTEKWWSSSVGIMTSPISGIIKNVPNH